MRSIFVYGDFDWLETPQLIGELSYDSVRGNETYGFSYDKDWLAKYGDICLSEDFYWRAKAGNSHPHTTSIRPSLKLRACLSIAWQTNPILRFCWPRPRIICIQLTKPRALSTKWRTQWNRGGLRPADSDFPSATSKCSRRDLISGFDSNETVFIIWRTSFFHILRGFWKIGW